MVQAILQLMTFDEFIAWYPENGCYELFICVSRTQPDTGSDSECSWLENNPLNRIDLLSSPPFFFLSPSPRHPKGLA